MGMRNNGADSVANSGALTQNFIIHAGQCRIYDIVVCSQNVGKLYAQLHDAATEAAVTPGAVPVAWVELDPTLAGSATSIGSLSWPGGRPMRLGAIIMMSSTAASFTEVISNDFIVDGTYTGHA